MCNKNSIQELGTRWIDNSTHTLLDTHSLYQHVLNIYYFFNFNLCDKNKFQELSKKFL